MFKSMTFNGHGGETNPNYLYSLVDSSFKEDLFVDADRYRDIASVSYEILLIQAYEKKRMPVATNLALFYLQFFKKRVADRLSEFDLELWRKQIDTYHPELKYSEKYYPCMRRQLKRFSYGAI